VAASNLDLALHRTMCRIRAFEEAALAAHAAGEVPGVLHVSIGQEAVAAGVCAALGPDDLITSNHRGHGHALAKGADPRRMMAELLGRAPGFCGGRGGSMHIADFSVGMLGANGVVAGGIPIAVGAAMGLRLRGERAVVACFFGDGAVNRGPFLEGLNWAALHKLPVLFVCEDNGVAAFTPLVFGGAAGTTALGGISKSTQLTAAPLVMAGKCFAACAVGDIITIKVIASTGNYTSAAGFLLVKEI
jgi:pyruvate dehydrogenase E1 component alpha subunit